MRYNVVSLSTGKDSEATLCYAIATEPKESIIAAFADTGNEHELVYSHLDYLEAATGVKVVRLRQDFSEWWWRRRDYIRDIWPWKLLLDKRKRVGGTDKEFEDEEPKACSSAYGLCE